MIYDHPFSTPFDLCEKACQILQMTSGVYHGISTEAPFIIDLNARNGVWGTAVRQTWPRALLMGIHLDPQEVRHTDYNIWRNYDVGLPPIAGDATFVLGTPVKGKDEIFVRQGWKYLKPDGWMMLLMPLGILSGTMRNISLWKEITPTWVYVLSQKIPFNDKRPVLWPHALYMWQKTEKPVDYPKINWLLWKNEKRGINARLELRKAQRAARQRQKQLL